MEPIEQKISELEMNVRAYNAFLCHAPDITTIRDLVLKTPGELLRMPNFGKKSLNEVKENLIGSIGDEAIQKSLEILPTTTIFDLALDYFLKSLPYGIFLTIIISLILRRKPNIFYI